MLSVCCDISETNVGGFAHSWYSNQVPYLAHTGKIGFGAVPNLSKYGQFVYTFCVFVVISQRRMGWFYSYLVQ